MTLETDWQALTEAHHFVLATKKPQTFLAARQQWGLKQFSVRDPEKAIIPAQAEPKNDDPRATAHFKITRARQATGIETDKRKLFIATDVVFSMKVPERKRQLFHKIERRVRESYEAYQQRLEQIVFQRYGRREFSVNWDVAVALGFENHPLSLAGKIVIEADLPPFSKEEAAAYKSGASNATAKMAERAILSGADFRVKLNDDDQPFIVKNKDAGVLLQLIAVKLPQRAQVLALHRMLEVLQRSEVRSHPTQYGIYYFAQQELLASM